MLVSAAQLRGRTHAHCDDRIHIRTSGEWHCYALADGAGSKRRSGKGAKIAVRSTCRSLGLLLQTLDGEHPGASLREQGEALAELLIAEIRNELRVWANREEQPITEFASTLLFAAHHPSSGDWILGHLGDGLIGGVDFNGTLRVLSAPENGEFANQTFFITDSDAAHRLRLSYLRGLRGIVLMSDGPSSIFYRRSDQRLGRGVLNLFEWQRELPSRRMSRVLRENLRTHALPRTGDDCTLLLAQTREAAKEPYDQLHLHGDSNLPCPVMVFAGPTLPSQCKESA